jgi:hypothetical protein
MVSIPPQRVLTYSIAPQPKKRYLIAWENARFCQERLIYSRQLEGKGAMFLLAFHGHAKPWQAPVHQGPD